MLPAAALPPTTLPPPRTMPVLALVAVVKRAVPSMLDSAEGSTSPGLFVREWRWEGLLGAEPFAVALRRLGGREGAVGVPERGAAPLSGITNG